MTTTISEAAYLNNVPVSTIRWQLKKNNIQPIEKKKWNLRGFIGLPYKLEDVQIVLGKFQRVKKEPVPEIEEPVTIKKITQKEVCEVLRKDVKSSLNNKLIKFWTKEDWKEFNNLKNR